MQRRAAPDCQILPLSLPLAELEPLRKEAAVEGFRFLERLVSDWDACIHRFDGPGECLAGVWMHRQLIAAGGIMPDPYAVTGRVGRLRHVYVLSAYRGCGVGSALVDHLLRQARGVFDQVRLRTGSERAAGFYRRLGFLAVADAEATHARDVRGGWTDQ